MSLEDHISALLVLLRLSSTLWLFAEQILLLMFCVVSKLYLKPTSKHFSGTSCQYLQRRNIELSCVYKVYSHTFFSDMRLNFQNKPLSTLKSCL